MENYVANMPPWNETSDTPAILTPIIYLENILEIDHDKKSITIYVTIDMEWVDSEIGVSYPEGFEYVLYSITVSVRPIYYRYRYRPIYRYRWLYRYRPIRKSIIVIGIGR